MKEDNKTGRRRRRGIMLIILLLVLAAGIVLLGIWQKNNLEAVKNFNQYTQEELEQQLQLNDQQVQDILDAALENAKEVDKQNPATPAPAEGEMPEESPALPQLPEAEIPAPVLPPQTEIMPPPTESPAEPSPSPSESPSLSPTPTPTPTPSPSPDMGDYEARLSDIVARIYALRDEYLAALDALQGEAVAAYKAIPPSQRKGSKLTSFVSTYIAKGTALEQSCDGRMDKLVAELRALQREYGQSMDLVDAVKYTYANEKSLKKAWYMSELERRGFI